VGAANPLLCQCTNDDDLKILVGVRLLNSVHRLNLITSHTNLVRRASPTGEQQGGVPERFDNDLGLIFESRPRAQTQLLRSLSSDCRFTSCIKGAVVGLMEGRSVPSKSLQPAGEVFASLLHMLATHGHHVRCSDITWNVFLSTSFKTKRCQLEKRVCSNSVLPESNSN